MLDVMKSMDPPMILWENLNASPIVRLLSLFFTYFCSFIIIVLSLYAVYTIDEYRKEKHLIWLPAIFIATIVSGTKYIMRKITVLEKHNNEASRRKSMVRKMVVLQFCTVGLLILLNSFAKSNFINSKL